MIWTKMSMQPVFPKWILCLLLTGGLTGSPGLGEPPMSSIYDFTVKAIDGRSLSLEEYRGRVILIVNVASKCGFTPQYEGLQKLYDEHREQGLVILGFPANNFLKQEPGSDREILQFCRVNYGVTFPMFSKISVGGGDIHPLYRYLTEKETNPRFHGRITWNFNKFLINRQGQVIHRFPSRTQPLDAELVTAVKEALQP